MTRSLIKRLTSAIRTVPDFPRAGIQFKDITPLLADADLLRDTLDAMCAPFVDQGITHVVGIESRGFLFGVPIAQLLHVAFVPARKPGKLPGETVSERFALEYGSDALEIHTNALGSNAKVLIVDDIMATGGTVIAVCRMVERLGGVVAGIAVLGEIAALGGQRSVNMKTVHSLLQM